MGNESQDTTGCLAHALADELRRRYPQHTVKSVAGDMGSTPKAAENLLNGHLSATSLARLIATYGPGFVAEAVMTAAGTTLEQYIDQQADAAEQAADRARERANELRARKARLAAARRSDLSVDRPSA